MSFKQISYGSVFNTVVERTRRFRYVLLCINALPIEDILAYVFCEHRITLPSRNNDVSNFELHHKFKDLPYCY